MPQPPASAAATNARRTISGSMPTRLAIPAQTPPSSARSLSRRRRWGRDGGGAGERTASGRSGVTVTPSMFSPRRARAGQAEREQDRAAEREQQRPQGAEVQLEHVEEVEQQDDADGRDDEAADERADVDRPALHAGTHASGPAGSRKRPCRRSLWRTSTAPRAASGFRSSTGAPAGGVRTFGQSMSRPPLSRSSTSA